MFHDLKIYAISAAVFAAVWVPFYYLVLRPLLKKYAVTAAVVARIENAEGSAWAKFCIWFEGKKTLAVSFIISAFATGKAATDTAVTTVVGLQPGDIAPLQDKSLWSAFVGDVTSLHIIAALGLLTAFLTLKGKVTAAKIVPAA